MTRGVRTILNELRAERAQREVELERWREEQERWREEQERWREEQERWREEFDARERERAAQAEARDRDWRAQAEADRAEQKRRFDKIDAAIENDKRVTREIVLELQEARERDREFYAEFREFLAEFLPEFREFLVEFRHDMEAIREALFRIFDRLDGNEDPGAAGA